LDRAFLMRGRAFHLAGKPTNALADLNNWLDRHPNGALGYYYRGQVYSALNEAQAAIADFSRSIAIEDSAGAREYRGAVHYQQSSYQSALDDFLAALQQHPASHYAANMAGFSAGKLGKLPQLVEFLNGMITADPTNTVLLEKRGELHAQQERWSDALTDYAAASRLQPGVGRLHFYRASFNLSLGDLPATLLAAEAALACADLDPVQRSYLVIILALGKPGDAEAQRRLRETPLAGDNGWPAPMIRFLRGEATYQHALDAAKNDAERAELRTYAGWNDLNNGRPAEGRAHLEWMTREGERTLMEYPLARLLLGRREPDSAQPVKPGMQP
jgi:tetratricopeptide (TPR) repeat protein